MYLDKSNKTSNQPEKNSQYLFIQRLIALFASIDNIKESLIEEVSPTTVDGLYSIIDQLLVKHASHSLGSPLPNMKTLLSRYSPKLTAVLSTDLNHLIYLIDKLFDYLLQNKHLLKEMSDLIGQLRITFFKVALSDKALFIDSQHPCRVFFVELINIAMLWCPKDPKTFAIKKQLEEIINQLLISQAKNQTDLLFERASKQLNDFSDTFFKKIELFEKRTQESEKGKAKIEFAKALANSSLSQITQKENIPAFVLDFINQVWHHILFLELIRETDNFKPEQSEALLIAKQLLVSLHPIDTIEALLKFSEFQPIMVKKLEQGLQKSNLSLAESSAFLEELNNFHKKIISNAIDYIKKDKSKDAVIRLRPTVDFNNQPIEYKLDKNDPLSIREMKLEHWLNEVFNDIPKKNQAIPKNKTESETLKPLAEDHELFHIFKPGRWFEIKENEQYLRCKFTSYIEQNDKFLFVNGGGNKVAEFVSQALNKAYKNKDIFIFDGCSIFENAYQLVVTEAKNNHLKQKKKQLEKLKQEAKKKDLEKEKKLILEKKQKEEKLRIEKEQKLKMEGEIAKIKSDNKKIIQDISLLSLGSKIEIKINNQFCLCNLAAKITSTKKYIFTDAKGTKIKELFEQELIALFESGNIRIRHKNDIFDDALASVISNMRNNKSDKT